MQYLDQNLTIMILNQLFQNILLQKYRMWGKNLNLKMYYIANHN